MSLEELISSISGFTSLSQAEKIRLFAWYLHTQKNLPTFTGTDIKGCYEQVNLERPASISAFLHAMTQRKPKEALRVGSGYKLEMRLRERLDAKHGQRAATVHVHQLLSELPSKLHADAERGYLEEALTCFKNRAFRTATVMCWNLAYDHLCQIVLTKYLADFNQQLPKTFPKADISSISKRDDFAELKESQVLQVCRSASITSNSLHKVLKEKLDRRNIAAHPSSVVVSEPTAEEYIKDLIENVVLKFN